MKSLLLMALSFVAAALVIVGAQRPLPVAGLPDVAPVKPPPLLMLAWPEEAPAELYDGWVAWINEHCPYGVLLGDLDWDYDVDAVDADLFRLCLALSGPGVPARGRIGEALEFGCGLADLDQDRDVDGRDWGLFQRRIGETGPLVLLPPGVVSSRPVP